MIHYLPTTTTHHAPVNKIKTSTWQIVACKNLIPNCNSNKEKNTPKSLNLLNAFPRKDNESYPFLVILFTATVHPACENHKSLSFHSSLPTQIKLFPLPIKTHILSSTSQPSNNSSNHLLIPITILNPRSTSSANLKPTKNTQGLELNPNSS